MQLLPALNVRIPPRKFGLRVLTLGQEFSTARVFPIEFGMYADVALGLLHSGRNTTRFVNTPRHLITPPITQVGQM